MVTMLAHGTLCRFAVSSKTATRDLPQLARFLGRSLPSRNASSIATVRALSRAYASALQARRNYATTASATQPTATVKKAVKAKAAGKAPPRETAAAKTTTKSAKKPAASKAKAKPKKKALKKAPKKAAPKKRVVKELTPEQEERANVKKDKAKLAALRRKALKEPHKNGSVSAHVVYIGEQTLGKSEGSPTTRLRDANKKWKTLAPAEVEHYNHLARERMATRQAEYRAWLYSHTPQQIYEANVARQQLRLKFKTAERKLPSYTKRLIDERQPKRTRSPFMIFTTERHASGDFKNISFRDISKLVSQEWKALSAGEKKKYEDESAADHARYKRESAAMSG